MLAEREWPGAIPFWIVNLASSLVYATTPIAGMLARSEVMSPLGRLVAGASFLAATVALYLGTSSWFGAIFLQRYMAERGF